MAVRTFKIRPVASPPTPFLAIVLAVVAAAPAGATSTRRYEVRASLRPIAAAAHGGAMTLKATLASPSTLVPVQSGADLSMIAKLAAVPTGCASDTIFVDGFDP
jgi:hypothetical protein